MMRNSWKRPIMLRRQRLTSYMHGACQFEERVEPQANFLRKGAKPEGCAGGKLWPMRKVEVTGKIDLFSACFDLFTASCRCFWMEMAGFVQKMRRTCDNLT